MTRLIIALLFAVAAVGCGRDGAEAEPIATEADGREALAPAAASESSVRVTVHRDGDDLVSAGLGLAGLTAGPPAADMALDAAALRRLAFQTAWTALAALNPAGGLGALFEDLPTVPGREFSTFRRLPGSRQPVRVLLQLPDSFDPERPCLVVAAASGSRGIYGALPLAAYWALPAGCALVHTDKGAGTDFHFYGDDSGVALSGERVRRGDEALGFEAEPPVAPDPAGDSRVVAMPHAHSGDHPEALWGEHVLDALRFAFEALALAFDRPFDPANTRVIATGLSNGGAAALRAAERDVEGLIDGVVAVMPNITAPGQPTLFEYASAAALFQPCYLAEPERAMAQVLGNPLLVMAGRQRCESLAAAGLLAAPEPALALDALLAVGFDGPALELAASNVALDLWRSVLASYASAYLRRGPFDMPCGFRTEVERDDPAQRQRWWASHSGIAPGGGIALVDALSGEGDRSLPGLRCLAALLADEGTEGKALRAALDQVRASARLPSIPVLILHGREDGLIPAALSARPYVSAARANGAELAYWEVARAQHFDALLAAPGAAGSLVPILPYGWLALDHLVEVLDGRVELGPDRLIQPTLPAPGTALAREHLGLD